MGHVASAGELCVRIHQYLQDCYERESPPRASELAQRMGVHPVLLRRRAQHLLGIPVSRYLKLMQLRYSCELLLTSGAIVEEIARRAAFGSRRSFLRAFQREMKLTPQDYRGAKVSLDTAPPRPDVVSRVGERVG